MANQEHGFGDNLLSYYGNWAWSKLKKLAKWIWKKSDDSPIGAVKAILYFYHYSRSEGKDKQRYWDLCMCSFCKFLNWFCIFVGAEIGTVLGCLLGGLGAIPGGAAGGALGALLGTYLEGLCEKYVQEPSIKQQMQKHDASSYVKNAICGALYGALSGGWNCFCAAHCIPDSFCKLIKHGKDIFFEKFGDVLFGAAAEVIDAMWKHFVKVSIVEISAYMTGSALLLAAVDKLVEWCAAKMSS
mmetsp:Transcript_7670/g.12574  ORF Transcript_7670/g.12574 Transcript_7670/m.12574 type:complete len:242 (+) Transcript_7670:750-1475(+)